MPELQGHPLHPFRLHEAHVGVAARHPWATASASGSITIPDVTGQNGKIAEQKLEDLGLTNVELSSANPKYSMVLLPANWTVVSIDPPPGTSVSAGDAVVVKVTKP
jgi:beta-lactam-binding protein with PASTA domain